MRKLSALVAVLALLASGSAQAQGWIEFEDRLWGVSINFPYEPMAEDIEYTSYYERVVPARVYAAQEGTGRYELTIVSSPRNGTPRRRSAPKATSLILAFRIWTEYLACLLASPSPMGG